MKKDWFPTKKDVAKFVAEQKAEEKQLIENISINLTTILPMLKKEKTIEQDSLHYTKKASKKTITAFEDLCAAIAILGESNQNKIAGTEFHSLLNEYYSFYICCKHKDYKFIFLCFLGQGSSYELCEVKEDNTIDYKGIEFDNSNVLEI